MYRIQTRNVPLNDRKRRGCVECLSWLFLHGSSYDCACLYCEVDGQSVTLLLSTQTTVRCRQLLGRRMIVCGWLLGGVVGVILCSHIDYRNHMTASGFHTLPEANQDKVRILRSVLCAPTQLKSTHSFLVFVITSHRNGHGVIPRVRLRTFTGDT